jgi:hypothetical protein
MEKVYTFIAFFIISVTCGFSQVKFPSPINVDSTYNEAIALLPDSSIILMSNREVRAKTFRFVYDGVQWIASPNSLTSQINSLLFTESAHGRFSFSDDYSRVLITIHQQERKNYYESKFANGKWGLFSEILKGNDLDKAGERDHDAPMYNIDLSRIYFASDNVKPYDVINYYEKKADGWSILKSINNFQKYFITVMNIVPIGKNGLLIRAWTGDMHKEDNEVKDDFFYTKLNENGEWTTPHQISELDIEGDILNMSLTPDKNYFTYTIAEDNAYIIEVPQFLKDEIAKSRSSAKPKTENPTTIVSTTPPKTNIIKPTGNYYALLIGNSDYDLDELDLNKPAQDVDELANILKNQYQFDADKVIKLLNSDRNSTFQALYNLRQTLTHEDNLLIFYAGHGYWDNQIGQGYWWPTDATKNSPSNWLSNSDLREQIRGIKTAHTLLISDACFSGGIFKTRGAGDIRKADRDIQLLYRMPSRRAITSGTLSTVPDNSVFFKYLVKYLSENEKKFVSSSELFSAIRTSVLNNSLTVPQDGVILNTGDEGGDFIFIRK